MSMSPIITIHGTACPLARDNVDTDQLCAARFMKRRRSEGYGDALLHDLRFNADGTRRENPIDAVAGAPFLVAGRNFGGGSSREAAVYAVVDAGFRVVIATSFGDIFAANAVRNGLIPARVDEPQLSALLSHARRRRAFTLDLAECAILAGNTWFPFQLDKTRHTMLLNGWDDLDVTAQHRLAIDAFAARDRALRPWAHKPRERQRRTATPRQTASTRITPSGSGRNQAAGPLPRTRNG